LESAVASELLNDRSIASADGAEAFKLKTNYGKPEGFSLKNRPQAITFPALSWKISFS
jgi:hypothetical protein